MGRAIAALLRGPDALRGRGAKISPPNFLQDHAPNQTRALSKLQNREGLAALRRSRRGWPVGTLRREDVRPRVRYWPPCSCSPQAGTPNRGRVFLFARGSVPDLQRPLFFTRGPKSKTGGPVLVFFAVELVGGLVDGLPDELRRVPEAAGRIEQQRARVGPCWPVCGPQPFGPGSCNPSGRNARNWAVFTPYRNNTAAGIFAGFSDAQRARV